MRDSVGATVRSSLRKFLHVAGVGKNDHSKVGNDARSCSFGIFSSESAHTRLLKVAVGIRSERMLEKIHDERLGRTLCDKVPHSSRCAYRCQLRESFCSACGWRSNVPAFGSGKREIRKRGLGQTQRYRSSARVRRGRRWSEYRLIQTLCHINNCCDGCSS